MAFKRLPLVRKLFTEYNGQIAVHTLAKFAKYPIPQGLIVLFNDTSIPDGWERFTSADDKLIVGAGDTYGNGDTGGSTTVTGSITTGTGGYHTYHPQHPNQFGGNSGHVSGNPEGAHSHELTSMTYTPNRQKSLLIKSTSYRSKFPAKTAILATDAKAGLSSVFTDDYYLESGSSVSAQASSFSGVVSYAGSHSHGYSLYSTSGSGRNLPISSAGSHNHTAVGATITPNLKVAILRALSNVSDFNIGSNMIALWESSELPNSSWVFCDGNNGTVNLQDRFIKLSSTGDGTLEGTGYTVNISGAIDTNSWVHNHWSGSNAYGSQNAPAILDKTVSHSHSITSTDKAWTPAYYGLYFIMYTGG